MKVRVEVPDNLIPIIKNAWEGDHDGKELSPEELEKVVVQVVEDHLNFGNEFETDDQFSSYMYHVYTEGGWE